MNAVYDTVQVFIKSGNEKVRFWTLLIVSMLVYAGMVAGITFLPKKKEGTEEYDPAAMTGWAIMVIVLVLVTWLMILMNPHGIVLSEKKSKNDPYVGIPLP